MTEIRQGQQHQEALRRSEDRYLRLIEEVQDYAILLMNKDGFLENWNIGAERIKGYNSKEIIGKNFRIFYSPEDRENKLPDYLLNEATTKGRVANEGWRLRKDGTKFWASVVITALHDENGELTGFLKVTRDLTERKLAEGRMIEYAEQLEQTNAELEQFAYVASHDLKEPLRKIVAFGDLLKTNYYEALGDRGKDYLDRMQNASSRMMRLIDELLTFSRINRTIEEPEQIDLNSLINSAISDLEISIKNAQAKIEVGELPTIPGRKSQLGQVFQNLISNAIKFNNKPNPEVNITAEIDEESQMAHINVTDNGIGFDENYQKRIFEIFQRLHGRSEYEGTGIGLAICKKIVEAHGGSISAIGEEGKGSTFTISIPLR